MSLVLLIAIATLLLPARTYWLMAANNVLTTQRIDPVMNPGVVSTHVHAVIGGSNFGLDVSTASLQSSECSSVPIVQDKSNYWYSLGQWQFYERRWESGRLFVRKSDLYASPLTQRAHFLDYLFSDKPGTTTAFPDDFKMLTGDPALRTFDATSFAQQAVTFICLDFDGKPTRSNEFPRSRCPSGVRSQINFPSCWDGKNIDSPDHRSHLGFLSTGPDTGNCSDPAFPITLPRIFLEVYWYTQAFDDYRRQAKTPDQPFVFSNGDPIGYSFHADFANGWDAGALQTALDGCNCDRYGDPSCCAAKGIFTFDQKKRCLISDTVDEVVFGTLSSLPGNNPVRKDCGIEYSNGLLPALLSPVYVSNNIDDPPRRGSVSVTATKVNTTQPQGTCGTDMSSGADYRIRMGGTVLLSVIHVVVWMLL